MDGIAWVEALLESHLQVGGLVVLTSHQPLQRITRIRTLTLGN